MREHDALERNPHVSRKALEALHSQLYGWALSRCGYDKTEAEDLMQQAYVEILSGRARFDNQSSLKTFVFGIVQNLARNSLRRLAVHLRLARSYADGESAQQHAPDGADHREHALVWKAVASLPQRQRDITELVFCRDMTIEQASQVMGVTTGTGRMHYDRAKKYLALALADIKKDQRDP